MRVLLACTVSLAAAELRRVRLRSGEYPAEAVSEEVDESQARVGGLGGSPMPAGCHPWLHRPSAFEDQSSFHPLQLASTVLVLAGPVRLTSFQSILQSGGKLSERIGRYLPDHRRYSRGGSLWAFNWQLRGAGAEELAPGEQTTWLGRTLQVIAAARAITDPCHN